MRRRSYLPRELDLMINRHCRHQEGQQRGRLVGWTSIRRRRSMAGTSHEKSPLHRTKVRNKFICDSAGLCLYCLIVLLLYNGIYGVLRLLATKIVARGCNRHAFTGFAFTVKAYVDSRKYLV